MKQDSFPPMRADLPSVRIKGQGASSLAHGQARAVTQALEHAIQGLAESGSLEGRVHIDRLDIKLPAGASERQIEESIVRVLRKSLQNRGRGNGRA